MSTTQYRQTIAHDAHRGLRLPVLSPYYQRQIRGRRHSTGRDTKIVLALMINTYIVRGFQNDGPNAYSVFVDFIDPSDLSISDREILDMNMTAVVDTTSLQVAALAAINAYIPIAGYTITNAIWPLLGNVVYAPSSYQTIVSQTGTAAPAVSGSLSPLNSYPSGTTFTWARTSAGVYTLTASAAVFNTSGKTAVIVGSLNNLNGAWKAVVTSSTVITLTTAVQSLAVLGLLGFAATPTDALFSQTAIQVLTYA